MTRLTKVESKTVTTTQPTPGSTQNNKELGRLVVVWIIVLISLGTLAYMSYVSSQTFGQMAEQLATSNSIGCGQ